MTLAPPRSRPPHPSRPLRCRSAAPRLLLLGVVSLALILGNLGATARVATSGSAPTSGTSVGVGSDQIQLVSADRKKKKRASKAARCKTKKAKRTARCKRLAAAAAAASAPAKTAAPKVTAKPAPTAAPRTVYTPAPISPPLSSVVLPPGAAIPFKPLLGFIGADSEWTRDVSRAPIAANSAGLVANVANQVAVRYGGGAAFNVWNYNSPFYRVTASTPRHRVTWDNCQRKTFTPRELYDPARGAHFVDVPIPDEAVPATGSDGVLTMWDPVGDKLYELWRVKRTDAGWSACWGGRIDDWSRSKGFFTNGMGVSASGMSVAAGLIGVEEVMAGRIDHAINLGLVDIRHWSEFSYPAQRSDGSQPRGTLDAVAEGQRFRLDPSIDVSTLNLSPIAKIIARAAQTYGFIVVDKAGAVGVGTESGRPFTVGGGPNPWTALMGSTPSYQIMKNFPWHRLQALPFDYGKPVAGR